MRRLDDPLRNPGTAMPPSSYPPEGLLRRLGAMLYDTLLVVALLMCITAAYIFIALQLQGDTLAAGKVAARGALYQSILLISTFGFFAYFWTRHGQTLGMQAWRLRIQNSDGSTIRLPQAVLRFFGALFSLLCLGLGYGWMLVDRDRMTWHDRLSSSLVVQLPKPEKKRKKRGG